MNKPLTLLALGDSYTIGEAVEEQMRWPNQLKSILQHRGINLSFIQIIATTGWTTDELNKAIDDHSPKGPFDYVSLLIGVNNQYRGYSLDTYKLEFESLLKRAIDYADNDVKHVIVLSIPDWGVTPFAEGRDRAEIAKQIDDFNAANKDISLRYGVHYIDITPGSRLASSDSTLVATDGLHPSGKMYTAWAEQVAPLFS